MKKIIALSAAFIITAVSCSSAKITEREPVFTEDGKAVITVGSYGITDRLLGDGKGIPEDIEVRYIDFCEGHSVDPYDKQQLKALRMEMDKAFAKGDVPDILLLGVEDVMRLDRLGILADMFPLMDGYDGIKRDDLTDAAIAGLTVDGRFPALMTAYDVCVPVAKSKFVPQEYDNWTAEDAMGFYEELPDDMAFLVCCELSDGGSRCGLADYMLRTESAGCIDSKRAVCDFSGKFADILQFCKDNPIYPKDVIGSELTDAEFELYINSAGGDRCLVQCDVFSGDNIIQTAGGIYLTFGGEDVTFVGYPSENGCGAEIVQTAPRDVNAPMKASKGVYLYCITERCANKEAAWELVCRMAEKEDTSGRSGGISVFRDRLMLDYDEYIAGLDPDIDRADVVPKAYYERVRDYFMSVPANPYRSGEIDAIISEEYQQTVEGDRSVKDTVKILNDRVGTYLSERS